ncbi:MAG TPA: hypothetical protein VHN37_06765 [Actinomycetota bacterium]|nr:hypothetical protein [Actinomycetota bacterium]
MTRVEDRLAALLEKKAAEAGHSRPLSPRIARSAVRARFVRKVVPVLALAGISLAAAFAGATVLGREATHAPAANAPVPAPQLSGSSGTNEWRLTALADGNEHCLIVRVSYEGREIDKSYNCGVHVGDVHPHMGPGVTTINGGGGMVGVLGQVGPEVATVAVESEAGRATAAAMAIDWDTPPQTGFYIFFLPSDLRAATLSTYEADGELIRETPLEFVAGQAFIRD